jgi:hypothetical protein
MNLPAIDEVIMPAPYSVDLRWRIVRACERGTQSQREVVERFEVSLATVENLLRLYRRTGDVTPQTPAGGPRGALNAEAREQLRQWVKQQPDVTLIAPYVGPGVSGVLASFPFMASFSRFSLTA